MDRQASARRKASREKKSSTIWLRVRRRSSICEVSCVASSHAVAICVVLKQILLANARERIADQHVNDPAPAVARRDQHGTGRLLPHFADHLSIFATRREVQGIE